MSRLDNGAHRQERVNKVNELVEVIGRHGRGFFHHDGRYAKIEMDLRGRLWWVDEWRGSRSYLHYRYWGRRKFSNGGTLRSLVNAFKEYVMTGKPIPRCHFYWPSFYCEGDVWGYGPGMEAVRDAVKNLRLCEEL